MAIDEQKRDGNYSTASNRSSGLRTNPVGFANQRIDDGIEHLILLSNQIREHGSAKGHEKASKYEPRDENGNSLVPNFRAYATAAVRRELGPDRCATNNELSVLSARFVDTIVFRWRRILYRTRQPARRTQPIKAPDMELRREGSVIKKTGEGSHAASKSQGQSYEKTGQQIASSHTTSLPSSFQFVSTRKPKVATSTLPRSTMGPGKLEIPGLPKDARASSLLGYHPFACPYCKMIQEYSSTSEHGWKQEWS